MPSALPYFQMRNPGEINLRKMKGARGDLTWSEFSNLLLCGLDASGLDLCNSCFRGADLAAIFQTLVSTVPVLNGTKISGTYFSTEPSAEQIRLPAKYGMRMQYHK